MSFRILNKKVVTPLFLISLTFLVWTISYKLNINLWWPSIITFIVIWGVVYNLNKKFGDTEDIDFFPKKIFALNIKPKLILSIILIFLSILLFLFYDTQNDNTANKKGGVFAGTVFNENNEPVDSVIILLQELDILDTTDNYGRFNFGNLDTSYNSISVIAYKIGYKTYEAEGSIGNNNYNFTMTKK